MVMQSIDLADYLDISKNFDGLISLTIDDPDLTTGDDNLIIKAAKLLRLRSGNNTLGASISLHKNIPIGAGLAGGSSDGMAALLGLNSIWGLNLSRQELIEIASELGSDMPFCLDGGTQLCFGRGEKLEPLPLDSLNDSMALILVKDPLVSVSTPWAYQRCKEMNEMSYLNSESEFEQRRQNLRQESWLRFSRDGSFRLPLKNDLQSVVAPEVSSVNNALKILSDLPGSLGFAMSGSGPSCFAIYKSVHEARDAFEQNRNRFEDEGLESWCCSFQSQGVTLES